MVCPFCKSENTRVVDKRDNKDTNTTRRRRECDSCGKRFTTYERIEKVLLNVLKRDGRVEEFDREKLRMGILKAVKKRAIPDEKIEEMIDNIENTLMLKDTQTIRSVDIGEMTLREISKVDKLGALLFAAVYKEFQSLEDVQKELERLDKK
jgi:transcriptional repressor NrdR